MKVAELLTESTKRPSDKKDLFTAIVAATDDTQFAQKVISEFKPRNFIKNGNLILRKFESIGSLKDEIQNIAKRNGFILILSPSSKSAIAIASRNAEFLTFSEIRKLRYMETIDGKTNYNSTRIGVRTAITGLHSNFTPLDNQPIFVLTAQYHSSNPENLNNLKQTLYDLIDKHSAYIISSIRRHPKWEGYDDLKKEVVSYLIKNKHNYSPRDTIGDVWIHSLKSILNKLISGWLKFETPQDKLLILNEFVNTFVNSAMTDL